MKLPEAVVVSVRNLVASIQPTNTGAYERLKDCLTASYSKSKWQQVFSLLKHPELGDRRPSQMMNEMLALLPDGDNGDSTIFLGLFLLHLPSPCATISPPRTTKPPKKCHVTRTCSGMLVRVIPLLLLSPQRLMLSPFALLDLT